MLECWNAGMGNATARHLLVLEILRIGSTAHDWRMRQHDRDILKRTTAFAVRVIRMVNVLPRRTASIEIGRQLVRSAGSIGAHCREARRARSIAEFKSKLAVAQQEAEETAYWLQLIADSDMLPAARLASLRDEIDQLLAILIAAERTAASRRSVAD
ncbi:MAG: four helix bundle protein [Planctomycetota bacterium]